MCGVGGPPWAAYGYSGHICSVLWLMLPCLWFHKTAVFTGDQPFLMSVRNNIIFGISLDPEVKSNDAMVPIAGIQNGFDVEFDDSEQFIYWVENPVSFGYIQCVWSLFK